MKVPTWWGIHFDLLFVVGWIMYMFGTAVEDVGRAAPCGELFDWTLPLAVLLVMGGPLFIGISVGRNLERRRASTQRGA